jgi:DNA ligase (NAD+)
MSEATPVEDLTPEEAAAELERLAILIAEADAAYYQEDAPLMTDAEYDAARLRNAAIEARFPDLKREDSPSDRVGATAHEGFAKAAHAAPMLSLDNAFSDEDVSDFADRIRRFLGLGSAPRRRWRSRRNQRLMGYPSVSPMRRES